ncbi:MAG: PEP-CTERM sorting domain-containing protein [Accumulibacter sp.]|jgi:hypothetical protein|uniref:PEP-CTERM sorting domain-containing protein n=1 Tax=Accumulibacter sp. TaxID=2053492 RepID=UPI002FC3829B
MKLKRSLVALAALLLTAGSEANALNLTLDFQSLPSAQGWTFATNNSHLGNAAESLVYSTCTADGLPALCMDSTQLPYSNSDGSAFWYTRADLELSNPFTVLMRARLLEEVFQGFPSGRNAFGLFIDAYTGSGLAQFGVGADPSRIQSHVKNYAEILTPFDTRQWHDYRFVVQPGGAFELFVDGATTPIVSGPLLPSSLDQALNFGDGTSFNAVRAEITMFQVTQVPEPSTSLMVSLGVVSALCWSRRRQVGNRAA